MDTGVVDDYSLVSYPTSGADCASLHQYACKKAKTSVGVNVVCPTASADFNTVIDTLSFVDCYYFSIAENKKSYTAAAASCAANSGSHLVDINTNDEGIQVWSNLADYGNTWIGSRLSSPLTNSCQACEVGKYTTTPETGNTACLSCAAGKYSSTTGASTSATCADCSSGTYSNQKASGCFACLAGKFLATVGTSADSCTGVCAAGTGSNTGATAQGTTAGQCGACAAGKYSVNAGSSWGCIPCAAGKFFATVGTTADSCTGVCAAGTGSNTGATALGTTAGQCGACAAGKYSVNVGSSWGCIPCAAGKFLATVGTSEASCTGVCPAGQGSNSGAILAGTADGQCGACAAGKYSVNSGLSWGCVPCAAGKFLATAGTTADSCTGVCAAGTGSNTGAILAGTADGQCGACPAGTYSVNSGSSWGCVPCAAGKFLATVGTTADSCTATTICAAGKYRSTAGTATANSLCTDCVAGTSYSTTTNAASCSATTVCAAGKFLSTPGTAIANSACTDCVAGTSYSTITDAASCSAKIVCAAGKYIHTAGTVSSMTFCVNCAANYYSTLPSSTECTACSANMKSVVGSTYCTNSILTQSVSFVLANIDATLFDALSEAAKAAISLAIREAIQIKASSDTYTIDLANIGEPDFTQVANAPATRLMTRSLAAVSSKVTVAVDFPGDPSLTTKIDGAYTDFKAAVVDGTFLALIKTQVASVASAATLFTGVTLDATTLGAEDTSPTMAPVAAAESKKKEDLALPLGLGLGLPLGIFLVVGILYYMHTNNMLGGSEGKQQVQYSSSEQHEKSGVELSSAVGPSSGSVTVNEI